MKMKLFLSLVFIMLFSFVSSAEEAEEIKKNEEVQKEEKKEEAIKIEKKISLIELKSTDTIIYRSVDISPTEMFVMEFPKGIGLDGSAASAIAVGHDQIIKVDLIPSPLTVKVAALQNIPELKTNLQIKLNCGITVIFNFRIVAENAASRVIFSYPEYEQQLEKDKDAFLALKVKLQKEYEEKVKKLVEDADKLRIKKNTKGFSEFYMCNDFINRQQDDRVFFTSTRICKWGGQKDKGGDVYINFYIKNRYRNFFYVKDVKVYGLVGDSKVPIESRELYLEKYGIKFDEVLNGAVGFKLDDYYRRYIIELEEESGKKRVIPIMIGF